MQAREQDKLHTCYIWHIITLATMKYKLRNLKKGVRYYGNGKTQSRRLKD